MSKIPECSRCGIWYGQRGQLAAVVVDGLGRSHRALAPPSRDEDRWDWLNNLWAQHGLDIELVLPESVGRSSTLGRLALAREIPVWLVPDVLVAAIGAAAFSRERLDAMAAVLARLPDVPSWRPHLRAITWSGDPRQMHLL